MMNNSTYQPGNLSHGVVTTALMWQWLANAQGGAHNGS